MGNHLDKTSSGHSPIVLNSTQDPFTLFSNGRRYKLENNRYAVDLEILAAVYFSRVEPVKAII